MAFWPFRRKGSRKRSPRRGRVRQDATPNAPPRSMTEPIVESTMTTLGALGLNKTQRTNSASNKKLQRRPRTYSFSPGRRDSIRVARARQDSVPPLPTRPIPDAINDHYGNKGQDPSFAVAHGSGCAQEPDPFGDRVPTLHHNNSRNKRRGQPMSRKKSNKRQKEDHDREAEIKALSHANTAPVRPGTDGWTMGRPMKKSSKRLRPGLSSKTREGHDSDLSLPIPESIDSSMSSDSEQASWRVSALDALAPRPTLRYSSNPIYGASSGSGPMHALSQKRKISEKGPIPQETLKAHKRIDDLADDLDASDLRELMERDTRRRERKKQRERERLERRLARRAERDKQEEAEAARNGMPSPQNLERGVMGREMVGLGVDTTSAVVTSSRRRPSVDSSRQREKRSAQHNDSSENNRGRTPSPLDEFHRTDSIQIEPLALAKASEVDVEAEVASEEAPKPPSSPRSRSISPKFMGFIRSRKQRSKSPTNPIEEKMGAKPAPAESSQLASKSQDSFSGGRSSDGSSSRPWTSLFRWGRGAKARHTSGPSSFSNTSRDSMRDSMINQPSPAAINYVPVRQLSSKVPKRTMSRFREDLPELPLSPPDSRVASPEAEPLPSGPLPVIADEVAMRYDTPNSENRASPISIPGRRDEVQPSPAPMSMSLASIDSEASWLSGRAAGKRASSGLRGSLSNYPMRSGSRESEQGDQGDDEHVADEEYLKTAINNKLHRKSTGEARLSSNEDEDEGEDRRSPKWGAVNQTQTPTVTRYTETMRSREGFLQNSEDADKETGIGRDSEEGRLLSEGESPLPQRATSINFGRGHVRNFSAGRAKLLEIAPRASGERRRSAEPVTQ
ncbi:uncharacterized protein BCR38DRAFT_484602 [Pseudomassariella vexata]|uniref:Uncharacterized protein n=1 Tax=Pseudomassariella vexata TaxID=1141098 RepID=A0A1Y2E0S4_9PEZI|nr:uncharacterized protein BCR38DRAFT_484602 [Pseudomassariella vexata]ORY65138.1 hypothetical protein BCR38DRAFT_484602 [Pseudomassariella vexata]